MEKYWNSDKVVMKFLSTLNL